MTRPASRVYRCQVSVEKVTERLYVVRSVPYPLHAAQVCAVGRLRNVKTLMWRVDMMTTWEPRRECRGTIEEGLSLAAEWVGLLAGKDLRERFHGVQRTAMGQGKCPYLGKVLCLANPTPGSVWCALHPHGRKLVSDDA